MFLIPLWIPALIIKNNTLLFIFTYYIYVFSFDKLMHYFKKYVKLIKLLLMYTSALAKKKKPKPKPKKKRKNKSRHSIRAGHIKIRKYNWYVKIKIREILVKLYRICYNLTLSKWFSDTNFSSVNLIMLNHSLILCYIFYNWRIPL